MFVSHTMINNVNSTNLSADSLQARKIQIVWGFLSGARDNTMGSRVVVDHQLSLSNRLHALKVQFLSQIL